MKPLKEKLQVHVKLIKPIYLIKTQHYEGFDFDLNGVLDDINYHLRKTIACMLERCQTTVFIECFYILCIN
ncbi:hypothetical protein RGT18_21250 [Solobacterium moorei]|nr:hypothetical protein RGT18_21250 [Solobacterium moorei]